ncbi:VTT domain-containing protein [Mesobacillus jeotgali]|jgi:membrane-associated protein|uniref:VTT domain-containing protein n=1 Tax=Mesobacillus jeotgali TaxID=129985 RepID=A0ABY9VRN2_9BACI|nr:VTT domain-containing protein [Mesobacillus jeotgali]WNF24422.1 VTT domain-containing protein [Mesobacillus jeotgali]
MEQIIQLLKNIDSSLHYYIDEYGAAIYIMLFLIVYFKTAFVILTFLPGDSMVFASGTLAAIGDLDIKSLFMLFAAATILGDSQNYFIGRQLGKLNSDNYFLYRFMPSRSIGRAKDFLSDYGRTAITASRFVPLMRTSLPFVSGFTGYEYKTFLGYNLLGGLLWTFFWLTAGFILGNISWVEENLSLTLIMVSSAALIPAVLGFVKQYKKKKEAVA